MTPAAPPEVPTDAPRQVLGAQAYRRIIAEREWQLTEIIEHARRMEAHAVWLQGQLDDARAMLKQHGIIA